MDTPKLALAGRRSTELVGGAIWILGVGITLPGWAPVLLLLAALFIIPLGVSQIPGWGRGRAAWLMLTALPLLAAFAWEPGFLPAALTVPWLLATGWMAIRGAARFAVCAPRSAFAWGMAAACTFPAVGAVWLLMSRYGLRPLGLSDALVQATAMHFHYAGFALPLIAAFIARRTPSWLAAGAVAGVLTGVPFVALGITLSAFGWRFLEMPAAWFLAGICTLVALLQIRAAVVAATLPRHLLLLSSLSLIAGMGFAAAYALGQRLGVEWLDIPTMVQTHGSLNAVGFSLLGIVGWASVSSPS